MRKSRIIDPSQFHLQCPENKYYPLPADYAQLTRSGQREARIKTIQRQDTPKDFVLAWYLFRKLYLLPTCPGFFYHNYSESPPFHYQMIYDIAKYGRNLTAAPRGSAKSVIIGTELPLFLLLSRAYIRLVLSLATDKLIETRFDILMTQLIENEFIRADFGNLKPPRGTAIFNHHNLTLTNGSKIEGFSVTGRKRGARPDLFLLDDPEFDPESEFSSVMMRDKFEVFLFRQVIPMLEKGSSIAWIGTMINRRSFLYHACYGEDPRFSFWNRKVLAAIQYNPHDSNKVSLLWEGAWDQKTLEARRQEIGEAAFSSEYMNNPISDDERTLNVNDIRNEYRVLDESGENPLLSESTIEYHKQDIEDHQWKKETVKCREFYNTLYRMITVDSARGMKQHNDYSCIAVIGFDKYNCMWVLDMWMGRAKRGTILSEIYKMGMKWSPRVIGIETISDQKELLDAATTFLAEKMGSNWMPKIMPVDYAGVRGPKSKADRISTLEWRFTGGKIKYPAHLRDIWPFSMLYAQTRDFTYDLALLAHDDAIDSVAMAHYVLHSRGSAKPLQPVERTMADKIKAGEIRPHGLPILSGTNINELNPETLQALIDRSYKTVYNGEIETRNRPKRKPYLGRRRRHGTNNPINHPVHY